MPKHNNVIHNNHFRKDWQRYVKTWFDQPAKKVARRAARDAKAAALAPRPVNLLRPIVRGQTNKYNSKNRLGRGFTLDELRAAGVSPKQARSIGIAVDHRRSNRSNEGFQVNVNRLKQYLSKLVIFPRKNGRVKQGDSSGDDLKAVQQVTDKAVIAVPRPSNYIRPRKINEEDRTREVVTHLRHSHTVSKMWGIREKLAKEKREAAKNAAGKK